jgi:hypothetical protein
MLFWRLLPTRYVLGKPFSSYSGMSPEEFLLVPVEILSPLVSLETSALETSLGNNNSKYPPEELITKSPLTDNCGRYGYGHCCYLLGVPDRTSDSWNGMATDRRWLEVLSFDPTEYVLAVVVSCGPESYYPPLVGGVIVNVAVANVSVKFGSLCVEEQACETVMVPCDYR